MLADIDSLESLRGRVVKLKEAKANAEKVVIQHQASFDAALSNLKEMFNVDSLEEGEAHLQLLKDKASKLVEEVEVLISSAEKTISGD
ncbi:MAG: hypothetical protein ACO3L1_00090 [Flavobacteriaceae bacterium]